MTRQQDFLDAVRREQRARADVEYWEAELNRATAELDTARLQYLDAHKATNAARQAFDQEQAAAAVRRLRALVS